MGPCSSSFQEKERESDRPITAEHQIEQSIIAMGDQFQRNYIHSLLLVLCRAQPSRREGCSHVRTMLK